MSRIVNTPAFRELARAATEKWRVHVALAAAQSTERYQGLLREAVELSRLDVRRTMLAMVQSPDFQRLLRESLPQPDYRERMIAAAALQPIMSQVAATMSAWSTSLQRVLDNAEVRTAMQALVDAAREQHEGENGLALIERVIDAGEVDPEVLEEFDREVGADQDLNALIESATDQVVEHHPYLTRARARKLVVTTVWLVWLGTLLGLNMIPVVGGLLSSALGGAGLDAPAVSGAAGRVFDRVLGRPEEPPSDDSADGEK